MKKSRLSGESLTTYLLNSEAKWVKRVSKRSGCSKSLVVRIAIRRLMSEHKSGHILDKLPSN